MVIEAETTLTEDKPVVIEAETTLPEDKPGVIEAETTLTEDKPDVVEALITDLTETDKSLLNIESIDKKESEIISLKTVGPQEKTTVTQESELYGKVRLLPMFVVALCFICAMLARCCITIGTQVASF